ncbi:MAG: nucleotidyltransferase family protein [Candidatus Taylorbacteria bacterium]|nr:nucleotidyltransferase family protein [Candidatus Taylorbacteria bacterium]
MKAIIVAGGKGERLRPFTDTTPKPMLEVGGKPILFHTVDLLKSHGVKDFIIALCHLPEKVVSYFGDGSKFGVRIAYTHEDPKNPLGTAGAITLAKKFIIGPTQSDAVRGASEACDQSVCIYTAGANERSNEEMRRLRKSYIKESFIVTYADIVRELDVTKMIEGHKKTKAFATLNVYKREGPDPKSMIKFDDTNRILEFIERPTVKDTRGEPVFVNGSFYVLEPEIFDFIPESLKSDFGADIYPKLLASKKALYAYPTTGYFIDIGNLQKLESARKTFHPPRQF